MGSDTLVELRHTFWQQCTDDGDPHDSRNITLPALNALHALLSSNKLQRKLAWFVYEALEIFQSKEMLIPDPTSYVALPEDTPAKASRRSRDALL